MGHEPVGVGDVGVIGAGEGECVCVRIVKDGESDYCVWNGLWRGDQGAVELM